MRTISDEYELPDDDDYDGGHAGGWLGKRKRRPLRWLVPLALVAVCAAAVYGVARVSNEQQSDSFCLGCHTAPEQTYYDRASTAMAGALAVDLSSFHYQQIRGQGGALRCIECHQGNGGLGHRIDLLTLSARNALTWLSARNDTKVEKLRVSAPHLSNDGCVSCHQKTLLTAGLDNHQHNMLPVVYELWRNGGSLIPPANARDKQAIITGGLVKYDTALLCSDCHQTHRAIETEQYLERQTNTPLRCVQCHRDVGKGPLEVTLP